MNKPTRIMILGRPIGIMWDSQELEDSCPHDLEKNNLRGVAYEDEELIIIREDMEPYIEWLVLLHEIGHFINWKVLPHEHSMSEGVLDNVCQAFAQVLHDNKELQAYLGRVR